MPSEHVPETTRVSTQLREKLMMLERGGSLTHAQVDAIAQCVEVIWDDSMPDDILEALRPLMVRTVVILRGGNPINQQTPS